MRSIFLLSQNVNVLSPVVRRLMDLSWYSTTDNLGICLCGSGNKVDFIEAGPGVNLIEPRPEDWSQLVLPEIQTAMDAHGLAPDGVTCTVFEEVLGMPFGSYFLVPRWDASEEGSVGCLRRWFCYNLAIKLHSLGH